MSNRGKVWVGIFQNVKAGVTVCGDALIEKKVVLVTPCYDPSEFHN